MHRFYIAPGTGRHGQGKLELTGSEAHHATRVLRIRPGETVQVLDGAGTQYLCKVAQVHKDLVHLNIQDAKTYPPVPCEVTLMQAIPKGKIMESIIQKATELGVRRVVPILSERVVTHLDGEGGQHKKEKWQQVAVEAIKQCGSAWLPEVEEPVGPRTFLSHQPTFDLILVASLRLGSCPPRHVVTRWKAEKKGMPRSVGIWVGPEGDFSPEEYDLIEAGGAQPISLGSLVLRVETAAIYCLSVIHHELVAWE